MIIDLTRVRLGTGTHTPTATPTGGRDLCIMEAVAYVAGEPWSDAPKCASPVVSTLLRSLNDHLSDADRDRMLPADVWVPRLVGSCGTPEIEDHRADLALDWLIRTYAPMWLDLVPDLRPHAAALRALPEIADPASVDRAGEALAAVQVARRTGEHFDVLAYCAALFAIEYSAGDGAQRAAQAAAGNAAWTVALEAASEAAWHAAWEAAGDAAPVVRAALITAKDDDEEDAAWAAVEKVECAAWKAARNALQPTIEALQASALDLLDRMLQCGEVTP